MRAVTIVIQHKENSKRFAAFWKMLSKSFGKSKWSMYVSYVGHGDTITEADTKLELIDNVLSFTYGDQLQWIKEIMMDQEDPRTFLERNPELKEEFKESGFDG